MSKSQKTYFAWGTRKRRRERSRLMDEQIGLCFRCNQPMTEPKSGVTQQALTAATFEIVNHQAKDVGETMPNDVVLICTSCNRMRNRAAMQRQSEQ